MGSRLVGALVAAAAVSACAVLLFAEDPQRSAESRGVPPRTQQLARIIAAHELLKHHFALFEADEQGRLLVTQMCDAISQGAEVGVTWSSRQLPREAKDDDRKPSEFEQAALRRLTAEKDGPREVWSDDRTRYVRAVTVTHKHCTGCHEPVGLEEGDLIGFTSIRFSSPMWH